jgi:hypothetical protein
LQGLAPLQLPVSQTVEKIGLRGDTALSSAKLEMVAGWPVLRIVPKAVPESNIRQMRTTPAMFDLVSGRSIEGIDQAEATSIARAFGTQSALHGPLRLTTETGMDQWTVQIYRHNAPLYRADYADSRGTQVYISGKTGEVVQDTTRFERFWSWLGAVPHWLYPTILRQNGALWSQVVIWTSLIGCFLTLTGLWVGISRLRRKRDGSIGSPFHGLWWWHHIFGLFFGILTLTWVASGLLSMNPWGFLDSEAGFAERDKLAGSMNWSEVSALLAHVGALPPKNCSARGRTAGRPTLSGGYQRK